MIQDYYATRKGGETLWLYTVLLDDPPYLFDCLGDPCIGLPVTNLKREGELDADGAVVREGVVWKKNEGEEGEEAPTNTKKPKTC